MINLYNIMETKMKEVISKRNKKPYILALLLSVFSILMSFAYLNSVRVLGWIFVIVLSISAIVWSIFLIDPRGVIEREGDTLIIRRGMWKTVVKIADVLDVDRVPHLSKAGEFQDNCISIRATVDGKETRMICSDVIDEVAVIAKIRAMIHR